MDEFTFATLLAKDSIASHRSINEKVTDTYFHYTLKVNVEKILKDECIELRFTRFDCFADPNEGKLSLTIIKDVCDKLYRENIITKEYNNAALGFNPFEKNDNDIINQLLNDYYVCCFSKDPNSNYMWGQYATVDSCNLNFDIRRMLNLYKLYGGPLIDFLDIEYDRGRQIEYVESQINKYLKYDLSIEQFSVVLKHIFNEFMLRFKDEKYKDENESRLVVAVKREDKDNQTVYEEEVNGSIKYYILKTFIKSCLSNLILGPQIRTNENCKYWMEFLQNHGYERCRVRGLDGSINALFG